MTNTITLPRSVLEQALEALNASKPHNSDIAEDWSSHIAARRALRAALEQPPVGEQPETVPASAYDRLQSLCDNQAARIIELEQPQIEQEPVAWIRRHPNGALSNELLIHVQVEQVRRESGAWVPLYTHPQNLRCKSNQARLATLWGYEKKQPPRQPLTEDGITQAFLTTGLFEPGDEVIGYEVEMVRAIERAHGIGGEA